MYHKKKANQYSSDGHKVLWELRVKSCPVANILEGFTEEAWE